MAVDEETVYSIIAPPDATVEDVRRLTVEVYLNEESPPNYIAAEALGKDPEGNSVWSVTVRDDPESLQEASGDDGDGSPGTDTLFGGGGP